MRQISSWAPQLQPTYDDTLHIAMPLIGAGLGGGDWNVISEIIEEESLKFQPVVYEL